MDIWVDADSSPVVIKEILYRAAERTNTLTTLVANRALRIPKSKFIKFLLVESGFDVADNEIIKRMKEGDLVITADIPLAAEVIENNGTALNPRGELYTKENIRARLNMRDFMETLRTGDVQTGGPPPLNKKDRQQFANNLDKFLVINGKN
jgi:uncharacterized protein